MKYAVAVRAMRAIRTAAMVGMASALVLASASASAHSAPTSAVVLEFGSRSVHAELQLPESELAYAMPDAPVVDASGHLDENALARYVAAHVAAESSAGARWSVAVGAVREVVDSGHAYVSVAIDMTPPAGGDVNDLVLLDDAITHEVRNHVVAVSARDGSGAAGAAESAETVGLLQYPVTRLAVRRAPASPTATETRASRAPWFFAMALPLVVAVAARWKWRRRPRGTSGRLVSTRLQ